MLQPTPTAEPTKKWWILAAVSCGTFMATLDSSIVNIALPTLTKDLGVELLQVKWVVVVYLLVVTCFLLPFGRISDQFGRKNVFQVGFLVFTLGSALCGLASVLKWLVLARIFQALGVCMLMANGPAIITATFPERERGGALGILAMVVSAGLLSGPSIGGLLIGHVGWRSIFWVNLPVGFMGALLVHRFVKGDAKPQSAPFDWAGTLCQCLLLVSFIILFDPPNISVSGSIPVPLPRAMIVLCTFILGAIFFRIESDAEAPILDLDLLKVRSFWTANLSSLLLFIAYSGATVLSPFFLELVMGRTPQEAGLFMTAIPVTIFVVAPFSGRVADRIGSRGLSSAGALLGAVTLLFMGGVIGDGMHAAMHPAWILIFLGLLGVATGLFQSPNNKEIMGCVPENKLGLASAFLATMRNLGLVTGTGLATALYTWELQVTSGDLVAAIRRGLLVSGVVGVLAFLVTLARPRRI